MCFFLEIQKYQKEESKNQKMADEMAALIQTNKELKLKIIRLERDLEQANENSQAAGGDLDQSHEEDLTSSKVKLTKLYEENSNLIEKEKEYLQHIDSLQSEIVLLRKTLSDCEHSKTELQLKVTTLIREIEKLRRELNNKNRDRDKETFKAFVQLKREVQQLREENEFLRTRIKSNKSLVHLPAIITSQSPGDQYQPRIGSDKPKKHSTKST